MPPDGSMSLRTFYERVLITLVHADASHRTIKEYRSTLAAWEKHTKNPPLKEIDSLGLANFRNTLRNTRAAGTVNKHLRHVNHIIAKAGPPGPRNRDALGIIPGAPWAKELKTYRSIPRAVSNDAIDLMYQAADDYFQAFIVCAYNLGSRFRALIHLEAVDVDLAAARAYFKPEYDKRRQMRVKPLNSTVIRHLQKIEGVNMLRWTMSLATWRRAWKRIEKKADMPKESRFTPHDLKRTCATQLRLAGADHWQRKYMLDHAQSDVTGESYVDPLHDLESVVERMPQPRSFITESTHDAQATLAR